MLIRILVSFYLVGTKIFAFSDVFTNIKKLKFDTLVNFKTIPSNFVLTLSSMINLISELTTYAHFARDIFKHSC